MSRPSSETFHSRTFKLPLGLSIVVLAAACGGDDQSALGTSSPTHWQTTEVTRVATPETRAISGTIRSSNQSTVSARVMGTVTGVSVEEGDVVRKGQSLLQIDPAEIQDRLRAAAGGLAEIDQMIQAAEAARSGAQANLELANATLQRYENLRERRSVSPQEFDEIAARQRTAAAAYQGTERQLDALRARRDQASAELGMVRTQAAWSRVESPVDGIVTARMVDVGDLANPGSPLLQIDDPGSYRLDVQVEESLLPVLVPHQPVLVRIDATGTEIQGTIDTIVPALDPSTRTALVKVALPPSPGIRSGVFARAIFATGERQALVVPTELIERRGQLEGLYVLDSSGDPQFRLIRTGTEIEGRTEIISGVAEGDHVVPRHQIPSGESSLAAAGSPERDS